MEKRFKHARAPLAGVLYAALILLSAYLLIYYLSGIILLFSGKLPYRKQFLDQILMALGQCKKVPILPPLLPGLLLGAGTGWLLGGRLTTKPRKILLAVCAVLLFLPLTAVALWFTQINTIRLGSLLGILLPAFL